MLDSEGYIRVCKKDCNRKVTPCEVVRDVDCGFCDIPYIILEEEGCN